MLAERSPAAERCQLLGARLVALGRDKRLRRIGVIAANQGEGATTVALGLARALSRERGRRVLLLELDLRRPRLDRTLGVAPPEAGVRQYLAGQTEMPVLRRANAGFWVLSAGRAPAVTATVPPARLATLLQAADRVFDHVVADCPPLLEDGSCLSDDDLDGFVLVVRSRRSSRERVQRAVARLRPGALIGTVLNGVRERPARP